MATSHYMHSPYYFNHLHLMKSDVPSIPARIFTAYELEHFYNGQNLQPAYISVDGLVFDVTYNLPWLNSVYPDFTPGYDYSEAFAPNNNDIYQKLLVHSPILGRIMYNK